MRKPTDEQLRKALEHAEQQRANSSDEHYAAHALLYCQHRLALLDKVYQAAESYLRFGLTPHHHQELLLAVEAVRRDDEAEHDDQVTLGL